MEESKVVQVFRILVIDDEPSVVDALKLVLEDQGYRVSSALNGQEGLEQIDHHEFDLTVTDLRLPDMSGLDIISHIRDKSLKTPVILITAYATPKTVADAVSRGVTEILPKPFSPSSIIDLINSTLAQPC